MKKLLIILAVSLFISSGSYAIYYNYSDYTAGYGDSFTTTYTVNAGTNRLLLAVVSLIPDESQYVESITFDGVPLSLTILAQTRNDVRVELWYMVNPPLSDNSLVITITPTASEMTCNVFSINGVDQTSPFYYITSCSGTDISVLPFTIQEKTGNSILGMGASNSDAYAVVFTELGQVELYKNTNGSHQLSQGVYATSTNTGSLSIANYLTKTSNWALLLLNIEAD